MHRTVCRAPAFAVVLGLLAEVLGPRVVALGAPAPVAAGPFAECETAVQRTPARYEAYLCFFEVGGREAALGDAATRLDRLVEVGPYPGWALLVRAHVASARREGLERSSALYGAAADHLAARGEALGEVLARTNIRRIRLELGDRAGAEEQVARALAVARASGDREARVRALVLEASHLTDLGQELGRARAALLEAESAAFPGGSPGLQQSVLRRLANLCYQLGRHEEAVARLERLVALNREFGNVHDEPALRFGIANARRAQREERPVPGALEEVQALSAASLESALRHGDRALAARSHAFLADLFARQDPPRASDHVRLCLAAARPLEQRLPEMECLCAWARQVAPARPEEAARALARAETIAREEDNETFAAYVRGARLRTSWETRPTADAARDSLRSLEAIERLRAAQTDPQARIELFTNWTRDYYFLAGRLLGSSSPDLPLAFHVGERLRARVLLEALHKAGLATEGAARPTLARLDEVQAHLRPDELMLLFLVGLDRDLVGGFGGGSWVLAVSRDTAVARPIPDRLRLEATVPVFIGLLERRDGSESVAAAALYRSLMGALHPVLGPGVRRIVIVPDGVLNHLPFAALRSAPDAPPLGALHEIALAPSATLWAGWRTAAARRLPAAALVVADPAGTGPLRHARREGARVLRTLGGGSQLLSGSLATEGALKATSLAHFGILHFATHAVADEASPDRSAVLLAAGARDDDGRLRPAEAAALGVEARAIVLSACRTAAGPVASGEGTLSLARAFFEGGARAVVASHERLRDDEAERFFAWFYADLARGETLGASLRSARRRAITEGVAAATWAGVVLMGDADLALEPRPAASWRAPLTIVLGCLGVAALGLTRTGRASRVRGKAGVHR